MKIFSLLPILLLSACVTVNFIEKPLANNQASNKIGEITKPALLTTMRTDAITGVFTDGRDGQVYKTTTIGKQTWMAQNLNFKIENGKYYDNKPENKSVYGMLYNYNSLTEACPKGWHIPTNGEWQQLEYNTGMMESDTAKDMFRSSIANNFMDGGTSKMNVLFGGMFGRGKFYDIGISAAFWTSTREGYSIVSRLFKKGDNRICKNRNGEAYCLSLRCIKDKN